jgi:NADH dehydrogenase (ubiquinone) flavoprotein 2
MLQRAAGSLGLLGRALCQASSSSAPGTLQQAAAATPRLLQLLGAGRAWFATNSHDIFNVHRESAENNWNTEFDFTPENYKRVRQRAPRQPPLQQQQQHQQQQQQPAAE